MKMPTTKQIRRAWSSVQDEYFVRRNKVLDGKQYEVCVCQAGDDPKVLMRLADHEAAERHADTLDDDARAKAVLRLLKRCMRRVDAAPASR